jgi:Zn finger protein HypA/HybF involved in hydrogenase expression
MKFDGSLDAKRLQRARARRQRLKAEGRCIHCGAQLEADEKFARCKHCRRKNAEHQRASYHRQRAAAREEGKVK